MRSILKAVLTAIAMSIVFAVPSQAAEAEVALLRAYIGGWSGTSVLLGGEVPEAFSCRLKITQSRQTKINYAGRCSLVNMNLSVTGTIMFNDKAGRYEATMRSNVGFSAGAVGLKHGDSIIFNLNEKQSDRVGNAMKVSSVIELKGRQITVDFNVEFNRSGQVLTTKVPFLRQ